jgi:large exoprotein involved in heme utilization and adhesion
LQVLPGRTIALVGNGLTLAGGVLVAEAGQIELGSVASTNPAAEVRLNPSETGWQLDYPGVQNFGDIRLNRNAIVNTSGVGGGRIQMQGRQITLTGESVVASTTQGNVNGEAIQVRSTRLDINDTARLTTSSLGSGDSGDISIATRQLNLRSGGQLSAFANNAGDGGDMDISATETVQLDGRGSIRTTRGGGIEQSLTRTGLLSEATDETSRSAQGGTIRLSTQRLQIQNGAQVSASTLGDGRAGRIAVEAEAIALTGVLRNPDGSVNINASGRVLPSGLLTSTQIGATGNGGALSLTTDQLSLQAGAVIRTSTEGLGNAGDIDIRASSIEVRGIAGAGLSPSQISAASGGIFFDPELEISILPQIPTGRGGSLSIQTGDLTVEAGAAIAVGSLSLNPTQGAGSLGIVADNVFWLFRLEYA